MLGPGRFGRAVSRSDQRTWKTFSTLAIAATTATVTQPKKTSVRSLIGLTPVKTPPPIGLGCLYPSPVPGAGSDCAGLVCAFRLPGRGMPAGTNYAISNGYEAGTVSGQARSGGVLRRKRQSRAVIRRCETAFRGRKKEIRGSLLDTPAGVCVRQVRHASAPRRKRWRVGCAYGPAPRTRPPGAGSTSRRPGAVPGQSKA